MKRRWKILIGLLAVLAALLAVNAVTSDNQTKEAEITVEGGQVLELTRGSVQVTDSGSPGGAAAGQPIVLLHCYACSLHWFDGIEPLLAEDHRVIRIDLLGFGGSEKPESGYAISNQAQVVAEALNELDVEGALVAGNSMGASVATSLAEQASQLVDRVAVIDAGPNTTDFGPGLPFLAELAYTPVIGEALWRTTPNFIVRDTMAEAFAPDFDTDSAFENPDQLVDDYRAMTYSSFDGAPEATEDFTEETPLDDRLTRAAVPVLVLFGSEDQLINADEAIAGYSDVPGVQTEVLEGLGHAPQVEDPAAVAELLEGFAYTLGRDNDPKRKRELKRDVRKQVRGVQKEVRDQGRKIAKRKERR